MREDTKHKSLDKGIVLWQRKNTTLREIRSKRYITWIDAVEDSMSQASKGWKLSEDCKPRQDGDCFYVDYYRETVTYGS